MNYTITINCERCGAETLKKGSTKYCISCGEIVQREQARARWQRRQEIKRAAKVVKLKPCVVCGVDFTPSQSNQKYCAKKCADKAQRQNKLEWYSQHYKTDTTLPLTPAIRPHPIRTQRKEPLSLSEAAANAQANGLTYGKYIALRREEQLEQQKLKNKTVPKKGK